MKFGVKLVSVNFAGVEFARFVGVEFARFAGVGFAGFAGVGFDGVRFAGFAGVGFAGVGFVIDVIIEVVAADILKKFFLKLRW